MTAPLVWLPFPPEDLGEVPAGLRYEVVLPDGTAALPPGADEVELYVLPYRFHRADVEILPRLPRLAVVQSLTAGVEHIAAHVPDGVTLCNGRGIHDASTAELALTLILASLRGIPDFVRAQDRGAWATEWRPSLADRRVLVVGYGAIGAAIEARLRPFEVADVVRVARRAREGVHAVDELPQLLPQADVVVLVLPGGEATTGLVDASFLAAMRDGALLVNVGRGGAVVTDALLAEVSSGRLRAALDVTDPEPLPADHPLWRAPGVLISPHVGGPTTAFWPRAHRLVREQLTRFAAGEPLANVMD